MHALSPVHRVRTCVATKEACCEGLEILEDAETILKDARASLAEFVGHAANACASRAAGL